MDVMADLAEAWQEILPTVREGVTGVGVWTALNSARPVAFEDGTFVLGLPQGETELAGHLKVMATKRLIESNISAKLGQTANLRVIDGLTQDDWATQKRRDEQARKLQLQALEKMREEMAARTNWEGVYEQLSRRYAAIGQKSLPQNRARFFSEAVALVAEARRGQESFDELGERSFARCLERIAQYTEIPAAIVAAHVLEKAGEI